MEKKQNKFIAAAYKLYTERNGEQQLVEEAPEERPFVFLSGFGVALDDFERRLEALEEGASFDFTLTKEQAYGDIDAERVVTFGRDVFEVDGKFDNEHVKEGAVIPMQNEEGQRFMGRVTAVTDSGVTLDLNHPLAGQALRFVGTVMENREATIQEVQQMIDLLSGGGCGGGCHGNCGGGDCEGGCHGGGCEGGCGKGC